MTGRVADGQEDRFVLSTRLLERLIAPWIPIHGVVGMKLEVRTFFVNEAIRKPIDGLRGRGALCDGGRARRRRDCQSAEQPSKPPRHAHKVQQSRELMLNRYRRCVYAIGIGTVIAPS